MGPPSKAACRMALGPDSLMLGAACFQPSQGPLLPAASNPGLDYTAWIPVCPTPMVSTLFLGKSAPQ